MILIAESGSSKTDWTVISNKNTIFAYKTEGYNPNYYSKEQLEKSIIVFTHHFKKYTSIKEVIFYGSGCKTEDNKTLVSSILSPYFTTATIEVEHDLVAAARALCGRKKGIASILGTGSNSCLYDGNTVTDNVPSKGWILGDCGSGTHLGKLFIDSYLSSHLPPDIASTFEKEFDLDFDKVIEKIYKSTSPNAFFSSFGPFLLQHIANPSISTLVKESFRQFFSQNICKYPDYQSEKLYFTGSIAHYFSDQLSEVAHQFNTTIASISANPMTGLINYHS